ncbi:MAG: hypothetical protein ABI614_28925 [Planctomycetota bacterium]
MMETNSLIRLLDLLVMAAAAGCAPANHSYGGCDVNCRYCPPPPLPYTHYESCVCHSCAASPDLNKP